MKNKKIFYLIVIMLLINFLILKTEASVVTVENRQLMVDHQPFFVKGVNYEPIPPGKFIGIPADNSWQAICSYVGVPPLDDSRFNVVPEGSNDIQCTAGIPKKTFLSDEAILDRDFVDIQRMNANTVRAWGDPAPQLFAKGKTYGLKIMPVYWISYELNYIEELAAAKDAKAKGLRSPLVQEYVDYVNKFKGYESLLLWNLSNENASFTCRYKNAEAGKNCDLKEQALAFYELVNFMAQEGKSAEGINFHPVMIVSAEPELKYLDGNVDRLLTSIDIIGINSYRGENFGVDILGVKCEENPKNLFNQYSCLFKSTTPKPIIIAEFGTDAWDQRIGQENQVMQQETIISQWNDIVDHSVSSGGPAIGGAVFYWGDNWSKYPEGNKSDWTPSVATHDSNLSVEFNAGQPDGAQNLEYYGIMRYKLNADDTVCKLSSGANCTEPRQVYWELQKKFQEAPRLVQFNAGGTVAFEDKGPISIGLRLDKASNQLVSVNVRVVSGSTATSGADYVVSPSPLNVIFNPGETSKIFSITLINDGIAEPNGELLKLELYSPVNAELGSITKNNITINDPVPPGACVVKTAFNSLPMAKEVVALRHFRDQILIKFASGQNFVAWYYRVSPSIADQLARHSVLRVSARAMLTPLVRMSEWLMNK